MKPAAVRAYAQQCFSMERMVRDYLLLYQEIYDELTISDESTVGKRAAA
jgi:hypothetical protein